MIVDEYFKNINYYFSRGRGIAVYNADENLYGDLSSKLKKLNKNPLKISISDVVGGSLPSINIGEFDSCVILQNREINKFCEIIDEFINSLVFPFYYRQKPIYLISTIDRTAYTNTIQSGLLHSDYNKIVNLLLIEQLDSIVQNTTFLFTSPDFLNKEIDGHLFTPIEQIMNDALVDNDITFNPQIKIGRFLVDFVAEIGSTKIIIECDGRDFHNPFHDTERDKELKLQRYPIIHFTGSEIYNNIGSCLEKIQKKVVVNSGQNYAIDKNLDTSQKKAIEYLTGPIRVLAPAGSGKTKTLINRIVNLMNKGIDPNRILALAFNKKAKAEMEQRLNDKQVKTSSKLSVDGVKVRTFHSFGYEIIRDHLHWKFPGETDEKKRTRQLLEDSIKPFYKIPFRRNRDPLDAFLVALRRTKMELPHEEITVEDNDKVVPFGNIFNRYLNLQTQHNFFNYDDMIYLALRVIIDDNVLRKRLQSQFEYILVDEFQDLNKAQILLMQILGLPQNNLFIVGDDDQMIYGWRGAEITHILEFNKRYAESEDCTLSTNYRSNKRIVNHSRWLIDHNSERVGKDIHPLPNKPSGAFDIKLSDSLYQQAVEIRDWMQTIKQNESFDWKDFAVLFRYNASEYLIAMTLDSAQIPHTPVDGRRLFQTNVGKDIFSYMRLILHPEDCSIEDFARILKRPNRSLSNQIINQITSLRSFLGSPDLNGLQQWQGNKLQDVVRKVEIIRQKVISGQIDSSQKLISIISNEFGFREFYQDQTKQNIKFDDASDDVLLDVIIAVARNKPKTEDFFVYVYNSLFDENNEFNPGEHSRRDEVVLTTVHSTKGNEYSNVAYFNLASNNRLTKPSDIEEERRVAYVGVTRAIKNILITAPKKGYSFFLNELAFNPEFAGLNEVRLNSQLSHYRCNEGIKQTNIETIENRINEIKNKFPELKGDKYNIPNGFLKNVKSWLRQRSLHRASNKIDNLENKKSNLLETLLPIQDMIEKIQIEKSHREILTNR